MLPVVLARLAAVPSEAAMAALLSPPDPDTIEAAFNKAISAEMAKTEAAAAQRAAAQRAVAERVQAERAAASRHATHLANKVTFDRALAAKLAAQRVKAEKALADKAKRAATPPPPPSPPAPPSVPPPSPSPPLVSTPATAEDAVVEASSTSLPTTKVSLTMNDGDWMRARRDKEARPGEEPGDCKPPDPRGYLFPVLSNQFNNQLIGLAESIRLSQRLGRILVLSGFVEVIANATGNATKSRTSDGIDFYHHTVQHRLRRGSVQKWPGAPTPGGAAKWSPGNAHSDVGQARSCDRRARTHTHRPMDEVVQLQTILPLVDCVSQRRETGPN